MPVRRHTPVMAVPRHHTYSAPRHDYDIDASLQRADFLSHAALEDTYDAASRSRTKDKDLLRNVNSAIIDTEVHESPRAAVVSRRVRASTAPPAPRPLPSGHQPGQVYHAPTIKVAGTAYTPRPYPRPISESVFSRAPSTGVLYASRPPLPKPTERKAIRDVDGFTKPKNVMSWEHRIESRLNPDDYIYQPSSLVRMRERVKDVQGKMDRQRQLLDRYLDREPLPSISQSRTEGATSCGGDPDARPMSDLRRRLRRTLAKSKNNPEYYKE